MGEKAIKLIPSGWAYCFKRGNKFVFLNRKDQFIKEFDDYKDAETFANNNINLIDEEQENSN